MSYELLGEVTPVILGGTNRDTGKANPTELEGYFLRTETRPNKFNKDKPQNYYIFQTQDGERGLYGKAGLDKEMKKATPGAMTKVVNTGKTFDSGKGQPMIIFQVYQDRTNVVQDLGAADSGSSYEDVSDDSDQGLFEEPTPTPVAAPRVAAAVASATQQSRVQALLNKSKTR